MAYWQVFAALLLLWAATLAEASDAAGTVKWGIVGCANIARKNIRAIERAPKAVLKGIASRTKEKAQKFILDNHVSTEECAAYGSYDELLADPTIEAVYIPLPTTLHLEWVIKAAKAKKHILLDKPCALTAKDLATMQKVCDENGVLYMDGVMFMHHDRIDLLRESLRDSMCAKVTKVASSFSFHASEEFLNGADIRAQASGDPLGVMGDLGWYCIRAGIVAFGNGKDNLPGGLPVPRTCVAQCSRWSKDGVPFDCTAKVSFGPESDPWSQALTFDCSFLYPLRQTYEIVLLAQLKNTGDKIIRCEDFVIPRLPHSASLTVEAIPPSGGWGDLDTRGFNTMETKTATRCVQEANMFNNFSDLISRLRKQGMTAEVRAEAAYWKKVSLLTQAITDAAMTSMKANGKETRVESL
jgi:predicted dehydrogenase